MTQEPASWHECDSCRNCGHDDRELVCWAARDYARLELEQNFLHLDTLFRLARRDEYLASPWQSSS